MKRMGAVESDSVKSARKAQDKLHKAYERASETRERTLHGQEKRMPSMRELRDSVRFLINWSRPQIPPSHEEKWSGEPSQIFWASGRFSDSVT